jgi:hypothetical protein
MAIQDKYKFFFLLLAICFAPFYSIFKYSIFYTTPYWAFSGFVVIALFLFLVAERAIKGNWPIISQIDQWMNIIFFYYIWLCFQAVLLGSDITGVIRQIWQYVIPVMVYFLMIRYLDIRRIKIVENIICTLSFIVAVLFISEWVTVHLLGKPSFPWSLDQVTNSNLGDSGYHYPRASFKGSTPLSLLPTLRIVGPLGSYNHNTSLFMIIGTVFLLFRIVFNKNNITTLVMFVACSIAILICFSRMTIIAFIISVFVSYSMLQKRQRRKILRLGLYFISILLVVLLTIGASFFQVIKRFYFDTVFVSSIEKSAGSSILSELGEYISFLINNPFVFFTGTGFGYWSLGQYSISRHGADFGFLTFHNLIGTFGFVLIAIALYHLIRNTSIVLKNKHSGPFIQQIAISSITCIFIAIISCFHYSPLFHLGNYTLFFIVISFLAYIDSLFQLKRENSN